MIVTYKDKKLEKDINSVLEKIQKVMKVPELQAGIFSANFEDKNTDDEDKVNGVLILPEELKYYRTQVKDKLEDISKVVGKKEIKYIILIKKNPKNPQRTIAHELRHAIQHKENEFYFAVNTIMEQMNNRKRLFNKIPFDIDAGEFANSIINNKTFNYDWIEETKLMRKGQKEIIDKFCCLIRENKYNDKYQKINEDTILVIINKEGIELRLENIPLLKKFVRDYETKKNKDWLSIQY